MTDKCKCGGVATVGTHVMKNGKWISASLCDEHDREPNRRKRPALDASSALPPAFVDMEIKGCRSRNGGEIQYLGIASRKGEA